MCVLISTIATFNSVVWQSVITPWNTPPTEERGNASVFRGIREHDSYYNMYYHSGIPHAEREAFVYGRWKTRAYTNKYILGMWNNAARGTINSYGTMTYSLVPEHTDYLMYYNLYLAVGERLKLHIDVSGHKAMELVRNVYVTLNIWSFEQKCYINYDIFHENPTYSQIPTLEDGAEIIGVKASTEEEENRDGEEVIRSSY